MIKRSLLAFVLVLAASIAALAQPPTATVTGTISKADGSACAFCQVQIVRARKGGVIVGGTTAPVSSNGSGVVTLTLLRKSLTTIRGDFSVGRYNFRQGLELYIPDESTADLEDLLTGEDALMALIGALGGGSGSVTSVGLTLPNIFSVTGSPITSTGVIAATLATQQANRVWAGPATGSDAAPTFRALVAADIPSLSSLYSSAEHTHNQGDITNLIDDLAGKQPTGNYITALTGDVTATGPGGGGSAAATISNLALSKLATVTADRALVSNSSGVIAVSAVTATELGHLSGVTSAIQTQLGTKALAARVLTAGVGLSGGGDLSADRTFTLDLSELVTNQTLFDSSQASRAITFGLSGSNDPVLTVSDGALALTGAFSSSALTSGRVPIVGTSGLIEDDAGLTYAKATDALSLVGAADGIRLLVQAHSTQTNNLTEWRTSAGLAKFWILPDATGFAGRSSNASAAWNRLSNYYGDSGGNLAFWSYNVSHNGADFVRDTTDKAGVAMLMGTYSTNNSGLAFNFFSGSSGRGYRFTGADGTSIFGTSTDAELGATGASQVLVRATVASRIGLSVQAAASQSMPLLNLYASDGSTTLSSFSAMGVLTHTQTIGTTSADGLVLQNTTAAAAGAQQYSPRLRLTGQGHKTNPTAGSQAVDWAFENRPAQSTANPTSTLHFLNQINGGGYSSIFNLHYDGSVVSRATLDAPVAAQMSFAQSGTPKYQFGFSNWGGGADRDFNLSESITGQGLHLINIVDSATMRMSLGYNPSGSIAPSAQVHVINGAASQVGFIVQGAASQSADLQQWQNSSGSALALVTSAGRGQFANLLIANGTGVLLKDASGTLHIRTTADNGYGPMTAGTGNYLGTSAANYALGVFGIASQSASIFNIYGATSQTGNFLTIYASDFTTALSAFDSSGRLLAPLGSTSNVGVGFLGDPNTGLYSASANTISVVADGIERNVVAPKKNLTDATDANLFEIALPTLKGAGVLVKATIVCTDGTDIQSRTVLVRVNAVNKGGTYSTNIAVVSEDGQASTGTLTATWGVTNGTNKVTVKVNADTSLTPTSFFVTYSLENQSEQAITIL